jgi:hypothetical protein
MPERELWQARVLRILGDALYQPRGKGRRKKKNTGSPSPLDVAQADRMIRDNTAQWRDTCDAAGFCPDFVRDAYLSGRITADGLRYADAESWLRSKA